MPDNEHRVRQESVRAALADHKLDALLVSFTPNVRYLTGFTGSNGALLLANGASQFFTDPRYRIQSEREVACSVKVCSGPLLPDIVSAVQRRGIRRLGFERDHLPYSHYELLKSDLPPQTLLEPVSGVIERLRMVKSGVELALIRNAVLTTSRAFEQAAGRVRPGMGERELAAEIDFRMRRLGAERPAFETIVASGERSALPHAQPTAAKLQSGGLVMVDMGALRDGYASDMTRMLYLGRPNQSVKRMYRAVLEAQLAAVAAVRPGVTAAHIDRQARRVLRAEKLDRAFIHSTGHGLGLEIHEPPRIGKKDRTRLESGMVITIEPGIYLKGLGGIRIEDTVVVTERGCEVLTPTEKELRVI